MPDLKIVVLGCGPAGLTAAHAAALTGRADVRILSKKRKSFMKGAQYLHAPIPLVSGDADEFMVDYRLVGGSSAEYARKVYDGGRVLGEDTSADTLVGLHPAWDVRAAYDALWALYEQYVTDWEASPNALSQIMVDWAPDLVISSIPRPLLCAASEEHTFNAQEIWSTDKAFHTLEVTGDAAQNVVVCNAGEAPSWYRSAMVHGWGTTEWPLTRRPPLAEDHLWRVPKPISTTCNCFPQIMRVGRYGEWRKGVLVHHVFEDVAKKMGDLEQQLW